MSILFNYRIVLSVLQQVYIAEHNKSSICLSIYLLLSFFFLAFHNSLYDISVYTHICVCARFFLHLHSNTLATPHSIKFFLKLISNYVFVPFAQALFT